MFTFYSSPEFELRLLDPPHAGELFALVEAHRDYFARFQSWPDAMRTPEGTRSFLIQAMHNLAETGAPYLGIFVQGVLAGAVGFNPNLDRVSLSAELFFYVAEPYQGQGYVTCAARVLLDHAFREMRLHRVYLRAAATNTRSWAVAERLGFHRDGIIRDAKWLGDRYDDHYYYSLLRHEWEAMACPAVGSGELPRG